MVYKGPKSPVFIEHFNPLLKSLRFFSVYVEISKHITNDTYLMQSINLTVLLRKVVRKKFGVKNPIGLNIGQFPWQGLK